MKITDDYAKTITKTTGMVRDRAVGRLAEKHELHVLDVTWEDTARFDNSAVGPNISEPLKQSEPLRFGGCLGDTDMMYCCAMAESSDVEEAVIGHGEVEGPFTEIDGLEIERDDRYPVRVTVQFYKVTSNGVVSEQDMADIAAQINKVYQQADYVGSLVVEGRTGRPTEYEGLHAEPPGWWDVFWQRHFENTGQSREEAMEMLGNLLGKDWDRATLEEAEKAVAEARESAEG